MSLKKLVPVRFRKKAKEFWASLKHGQSRPNTTAVYIHIPVSIDFIKETLLELKSRGYSLEVYSDKGVCLGQYIDFLDVHVLPLSNVIRHIRFGLIMTSASGFPRGKFHPKTSTVHMFHSLVSIHDIYHPNAFNNFDVLCCAGPHHNQELNFVLKTVSKRQFTLNTGYNKVDRYSNIPSQLTSECPTILFAPSWHPENILRLYGDEIIGDLISDYHIILRPHPLSLTHDADIISKLKQKYGGLKSFEFDDNIEASDTMKVAHLMISDYSGVAMEFALSQLRPVVYIDGPKKSFNPEWKKLYPKDGVQVSEREKLGYLLFNLDELKVTIERALKEKDTWANRLKEQRSSLVYNFGESAIIAAKQMERLLKKDFSELKPIAQS